MVQYVFPDVQTLLGHEIHLDNLYSVDVSDQSFQLYKQKLSI